jgi:hypothetical protein
MSFFDTLGQIGSKVGNFANNALGGIKKGVGFIGHHYKPVLSTIRNIANTVHDVSNSISPFIGKIPGFSEANSWANTLSGEVAEGAEKAIEIGDQIYEPSRKTKGIERLKEIKPSLSEGAMMKKMSTPDKRLASGMEKLVYQKPPRNKKKRGYA